MPNLILQEYFFRDGGISILNIKFSLYLLCTRQVHVKKKSKLDLFFYLFFEFIQKVDKTIFNLCYVKIIIEINIFWILELN